MNQFISIAIPEKYSHLLFLKYQEKRQTNKMLQWPALETAIAAAQHAEAYFLKSTTVIFIITNFKFGGKAENGVLNFRLDMSIGLYIYIEYSESSEYIRNSWSYSDLIYEVNPIFFMFSNGCQWQQYTTMDDIWHWQIYQ